MTQLPPLHWPVTLCHNLLQAGAGGDKGAAQRRNQGDGKKPKTYGASIGTGFGVSVYDVGRSTANAATSR